MLGEVNVRFIAFLSPFERTKSPVCGGQVGQVTLKYQLDLGARVLLGEINAMGNCVCCNNWLA